MEYCYKNSTEVVFSKDVISEVDSYASKIRAIKIFFVSGVSFSAKIAQTISEQLSGKYRTKLMMGVSTNPTEEMISRVKKEATLFSPDLIVTVGGGSCHDCGKAVSVLLMNNKSNSLSDYTVTGALSVPGIKACLPIITIPTIVGSGAEVSPAALVRIKNEKKVIFSPLLHPVATIINTDYMHALPVSVIARSAFDSFIQSLEGYISNFANPISDSFALASIMNYVECLDSLRASELTDAVLKKLSVASFFSSYVCSVAGVGAIHAFSDPISGRYNVHHADALAMVAIEALKYNLNGTKADIGRLTWVLRIESAENQEESELIDSIIAFIQSLIDAFSIGKEKVSIDAGELEEMVLECRNPDMAGNPYDFSDEEIKNVLYNSLI